MALELCFGEKCELREKCLRYKKDIDPKKQDHLAWSPYDKEKKYCGWFINKETGDGIFDMLLNKLGKNGRSKT